MKSISGRAVSLIIAASLTSSGCSSSDELSYVPLKVQPSATELLQKDMVTLRARNDSLTMLIGKLEREMQLAQARSAELETRLSGFTEKPIIVPPAPRQQVQQQAQPQPKSQPIVQAKVAVSRDGYEQGLQLFRARQYQDAANQFQSVLDAGVAIDIQDNCHYWLGECAYALKSYQEAIDEFNQVFTFKISEKKDDAQMMVANSFFAMGNKAKAKEEYQKLIDKFPASPYVKRAKEKLSTL